MSRLNNSSTSFSKGDGTTASMADDVTADGTHSTFETMDPDHDYGTPPSFRPSSTSGDGDASGSNHNSHYQQHQHQQRNNNNNAAHFNRARSTTVMESRAGTPFSQQSARERSETVRPQSDKPRSNNTTTTSHSGLNNNNTHYDGQSTVQEYDENDQAAEMDITNKARLCFGFFFETLSTDLFQLAFSFFLSFCFLQSDSCLFSLLSVFSPFEYLSRFIFFVHVCSFRVSALSVVLFCFIFFSYSHLSIHPCAI